MKHMENKVSKGSWVGLILLLGFVVLMGSFLGTDDRKGIESEESGTVMEAQSISYK